MAGILIVALSGQSGCGNTSATRLVSELLGVRMWNYTFRSMAAALGMSLSDILEDSRRNFVYDYLTDLVNIRAALAGDLVIGTRLAIWLIPANLRVFLTASPQVRAARIAARENIPLSEAVESTGRRDTLDRARFSKMYGIDILEPECDLILNNEATSALETAKIVVETVRSERFNPRPPQTPAAVVDEICSRLDLPRAALTELAHDVDVRRIFERIRVVEA